MTECLKEKRENMVFWDHSYERKHEESDLELAMNRTGCPFPACRQQAIQWLQWHTLPFFLSSEVCFNPVEWEETWSTSATLLASLLWSRGWKMALCYLDPKIAEIPRTTTQMTMPKGTLARALANLWWYTILAVDSLLEDSSEAPFMFATTGRVWLLSEQVPRLLFFLSWLTLTHLHFTASV